MITRRTRTVAGAAALAVSAVALPTAAVKPELGVGMGADFNAGADTLYRLEFSDGSHQDIKAGNGLSLTAGGGAIFFDEHDHRVETVLAAGSSSRPCSGRATPISRSCACRSSCWCFTATTLHRAQPRARWVRRLRRGELARPHARLLPSAGSHESLLGPDGDAVVVAVRSMILRV
jgi:hypothetical protein